MPLTALDRKTALIVIDLQQGIVAMPTVHPVAEVIGRAVALTQAFRRHGLPVVLVNVAGGAPGRTDAPPRGPLPAGWSDLVADLDIQPSDHRVTKRTWGAFTNTDLERHLRTQGVTQVVVCGIATSLGVESTARAAHEFGFNVTLAVDAMTDRDIDSHDDSVTRTFPRLGETGTTAEIIALLDRSR